MKWRQATFHKRIQKNDSEDDPGSQKNNGEDAKKKKNVYQRPTRTKTQMNNILEGIKSRITEAKEEINDLEDRMVETTAA